MDEMALTRSRDKHPPQKVALEAQRIKAKVEKSDTTRRQKMKMDDPRNLRLAELRAEEATEKRREKSMTNINEIRNDALRLAQAEAINERADEFARVHGTDHVTAVREVVRLSNGGALEPTTEQVEKHMRDNDISDFGTALREVISGQQTRAVGSNGTGGTSVKDENAELAEILKARGFND